MSCDSSVVTDFLRAEHVGFRSAIGGDIHYAENMRERRERGAGERRNDWLADFELCTCDINFSTQGERDTKSLTVFFLLFFR